jgi:hypothetical protein
MALKQGIEHLMEEVKVMEMVQIHSLKMGLALVLLRSK